MGLKRIFNLFDAVTDDIFTEENMREYAYKLAPSNVANTPAVHEWVDEVMESWPELIDSIPKPVLDAASETPIIAAGTYVFFTPEADHRTHYCARVEDDEQGGFKYHIQWIDTFATPHDTDVIVGPHAVMVTQIVPAVLWLEREEEDAHYTNSWDGDQMRSRDLEGES